METTPKAQTAKQVGDYIKLKSSCTAKETNNKVKRQPMGWEKICESHVFDKELISKIYKELIQPGKKNKLNLKMDKGP